MKKAHILSILLVLAITVSAGCQADRTSSSEASATADSAAANSEKREIINGFIEKKSDDLPQLDLTDAIPDPDKENIYGHYYVLRDWSVEKCEDFAKSMLDKGFDSYIEYDEYSDRKVAEFYVYSSDEFYRFSPYGGLLSDLPWEDVKENDWSPYWCLEWQKTSSSHTGDSPDKESAFSAIKTIAADYFGGPKYLLDGCLVDETSDALYQSMGLKFCRVCTKPIEDTFVDCDQYLVGKSEAVPVSDICQTFDDRMICDIDSDGKAEAVFFDFDMEGDIAYFITVIGVENGDPYEKYDLFVPYDNQFFSVLEKCEEMSVDEETQALVLSCSSDGSGEKESCTLKVKNGELIAEKSN